MTMLERFAEGLKVGIPFNILRAAHPHVKVDDSGDVIKLSVRGSAGPVHEISKNYIKLKHELEVSERRLHP